jgi:hypothetical protein
MLLTKAFNLTFTQSEVDFVIPRLDQDLPLCIDPFLLYKSRDETLHRLHGQLLTLFNNSVVLFREGKRKEMNEIIDFPEVNEIGFGYSEDSVKGSGLGSYLNKLLADTLVASEPLQERGLRHIEELQLVSMGIAADRVSDIAANVLKSFLIEYTQKQANLWSVPLASSLPVNHYFDFEDYAWRDGYFDLPKNKITGSPILLVPRRMVRLLPWINLDDYAASDFRLFLRSTERSSWPRFAGGIQTKRLIPDKTDIVKITRSNLKLLDNYVNRKEKDAQNALPVFVEREDLGLPTRPMAEEFIQRLSAIPTGVTQAKDYQRTVYEIINYLFEPELTDGEMEVRTIEGTERRDIIYTNESDTSFWQYVRLNYGSPLVMFEVKNVEELEFEHINQTASYLGARLGMLGIIVTRNSPSENIIRKTYTIYSDTPSTPRKTILILEDTDLLAMLRNKDSGQAPTPTQYVQKSYREFRTRVQ